MPFHTHLYILNHLLQYISVAYVYTAELLKECELRYTTLLSSHSVDLDSLRAHHTKELETLHTHSLTNLTNLKASQTLEINTYLTELQDLKLRLVEYERKVLTTEGALSSAEVVTKERQNQNKILQGEWEGRLSELSQQLDNTRAQNEDLRTQVLTAAQQGQTLSQQLDTLSSQLTQEKARVLAGSENLAVFTRETKHKQIELEHQLHQVQSEKTRLETELEAARQVQRASTQQVQELSRSKQSLAQELTEATDRLAAQVSAHTLQTQHTQSEHTEELREVNKRHQDQVNGLSAEYHTLLSTHEQLTAEFKHTRSVLAEARSENEELTKQIAPLQASVQALEQQHHHLQALAAQAQAAPTPIQVSSPIPPEVPQPIPALDNREKERLVALTEELEKGREREYQIKVQNAREIENLEIEKIEILQRVKDMEKERETDRKDTLDMQKEREKIQKLLKDTQVELG